ncbi:MAG: hypothetical protein B7X11_00060, partial [Acidobacteria bacterium 37-65-4]
MPLAAIVGLAITASLAWPSTGVAGCFSQSTYLNNLCGTSSAQQDYELHPSLNAYFLALPAQSKNVLMLNLKNDLAVYDLANPFAPSKSATLHIPWDWTSINVLGSTHEPYSGHIGDVATLDGFNYALASLTTYGWDILKVSPSDTRFLGHGYHPTVILEESYISAALFSAGGVTYVVAQTLDQGSISSNDSTIRIYTLASATVNPEQVTPATIGPGIRVPVGSSPLGGFVYTSAEFTPRLGNTQFWVVSSNGRRLLLARLSGSQPALLIVDITNPASPQPQTVILNNATLLSGRWAVDEQHSMIWVAGTNRPVVNGFTLAVPTSGSPSVSLTYPAVPFWGDGTTTTGASAVSVAGDLIVAGVADKFGYLGLGDSGQPTLIPAPTPIPYPYTQLDSARVCFNSGFSEGVMGLKAFQAGGQAYVARALLVDADIIGVSPTCLSTTPVPAFTVAATTVGAPTAATCTGSFTAPSTSVASVGFPGDTFTISDGSTGSIATGDLVITPTTSGTQSWQETGSNAWQPQPLAWQSPPSGPSGEYQVAMTLRDASGASYPLTKSIYLCSTPRANVQITAVNGNACSGDTCVYLANDKVTFSAASGISEGTPTSWIWYQDGSVWPACTGATCNWYVPSSGGPYTVAVAAVYGFPGSVDSSCGNLTVTNAGNWASCDAAAPITPTAFTVGNVAATQPGGGPYPNFVTGVPIVLSATYKVASSYTANFLWALDGVSGPAAVPVSQTGPFSGSVIGTITSPAAGSHTVALIASATDGTTTVPPVPTAAPAAFTVTTCSNGAPVSLSPNNTTINPGPITLSWSPAPGASPAPTYTVNWGPWPVGSCTNISGTTCPVSAPAGGTQYSWSVTASNTCGPFTSAASFTTSGSVSTPTPTPTPTHPPSTRLSISGSPNPAAAGQTVGFTFSPQLTQSGDSLTFNFGPGEAGTTVSYPSCGITANGCSSVLHTFNPAATTTFQVSVSGRVGGQNVTGSTSVTVQVVCTLPAAPVAAFTYSPVSLAVQFTDTSAGGPTSWSWNFGDAAGLFPAGTSTAQSPLYAFRTAGTYTVTLKATNCKGSSQSQQTITVSSCNQTAAPILAFTVSPTGTLSGFPEQQQPMVGQAVTFDPGASQNIDSGTTWNWLSFGEPSIPTSTLRNPVVTFGQAGPHVIQFNATNCGTYRSLDTSQTQTQSNIVQPLAAGQGVPVSNHTIKAYSGSASLAPGEYGVIVANPQISA